MIPKFRAWLKDTKQMIDVEFLDLSHKVLIGKHRQFGMTEAIKFDDVELMQSLDLKDKNGEELFDGDIVRLPDGTLVILGLHPFAGMSTQEVGQKDVYFAGIKTQKEIDKQIKDISIYTEVVGNIWEDGDLIDNKKSETD